MRPSRDLDLRLLFRPVLAGILAVTAGIPSRAQQFPYQGLNYNWSVPYGSMNYNYGFMRYDQGWGWGSSYQPMMQSQPNFGMGNAGYGVYGPAPAQIHQGADPYTQDAVAQAMQTQRQMQAMEPRYDVRKKTPKAVQSKSRQANKPLTRSQVLSPDGKVLWPGKAPSEGELGKSRAAAEAAIEVAFKEFKADGKTSVHNLVEAKERLFAYGHPALEKAASQSRQSAQKLLHFLSSLEQVLNELGGV
jgi:hypothetical protein